MALGGRAKTSRVKLRKVEKIRDAFQLRAQGWSYRAIAEKLGCTAQNVNQLVLEAMAERPVEEIEIERAKRLEQLDEQTRRQSELIEKWLPGAKKLDDKAAKAVDAAENTLLRIGARRDALTGAEVPKRTELTGKDGGPLEISDVSKLTDEQLKQLAAGVAIDTSGGGARAETPAETEDGEAGGVYPED